MFEILHDGLFSAIRTLRGKGRLSEANMNAGLMLIQQSLHEADVSFSVVREFIAKISVQALSEQVMTLHDPTDQLVKIVHKELVNLMGVVDHSIHLRKPLSILMLCGLQCSGKTTTCGKLAKLLLQRKIKPMLVAADLLRPAAIDQLEILGSIIGVPVHVDRAGNDPVAVCQAAVAKAKSLEVDVLILDTAGRQYIDDELMQQLKAIETQVMPDRVFFVGDAMTGQDVVNSARAFSKALELDGIILTKLDGDTRGGAVLSVKKITGVPIKFIGTGETLDALEEFHPDRVAGSILGMVDTLTLIEQAQQKFAQKELQRQQERLEKGEFTLDDFRRQMSQAKRMGSIGKLMGLIPDMGNISKMTGDINVDTDNEMRRIGGIIDSMTLAERHNPKIIDHDRRERIAKGAGVVPHQVSELIKAFLPMAEMMESLAGKGVRDQIMAMPKKRIDKHRKYY